MTDEPEKLPRKSASGPGTILPAGSGKMRHVMFPVTRGVAMRLKMGTEKWKEMQKENLEPESPEE